MCILWIGDQPQNIWAWYKKTEVSLAKFSSWHMERPEEILTQRLERYSAFNFDRFLLLFVFKNKTKWNKTKQNKNDNYIDTIMI